MEIKPTISIVIPFHWMKNWPFFLSRCLASIESQTFKNYEVILMKVGNMPETSNRVISSAKGKYIKVLYMDDWLANDDVLNQIVSNFMESDKYWIITSTDNNPHPQWTDDIETGNNKLGSPSALAFRNKNPLLFDEKMSWLLDCDLYKRLYDEYGEPLILDDEIYINMGIHDGQVTNLMSDDEKALEYDYIKTKYE